MSTRGTSGALSFEFRHVGLNAGSPEGADEVGRFFSEIFGLPVSKDTAFSLYAGPSIEVVKGGGRGARGHIALAVRDIAAAVAELESRGVEFDFDSAKREESGEIFVIYLKKEIAGFAIHLQKA